MDGESRISRAGASLFAVALVALASAAEAQSAFKLYGEVEISNAPAEKVEAERMIHVWAGERLRRLDVKNSQFAENYAIDLIGERFRIDAILEGFVQRDEILFTPKDLIINSNVNSVYQYVVMVRRADQLHSILQRAERLLANSEKYRDIALLLNEADSHAVTTRSMMLRAQAARREIADDEELAREIMQFIGMIRYRPEFEGCFGAVRPCNYLNFSTVVLEFADTLMELPDLSVYNSATRTAFDEIVQLYGLAIELAPTQPRGFQGKYTAEMRSEYYFDALNTIHSFFVKNRNVNSSVVVRAFLTDLGTSVEKLTLDASLHTDHEQRDKICDNPETLAIWKSLGGILDRYKSHYPSWARGKVSTRLRGLLNFSRFIVNCGGEG